MDAVARGIHSAVIREASALEFKPFAHPARQDAPSAMIYADLRFPGFTGFLLSLFNKTFFETLTALHDAFTLEHCFRKACTAAQHA